MVAELTDALQTNLARADKIKRLGVQLKESEEALAHTERICQKKLGANKVFINRCLAAQLKVEQYASFVEEEARSLKNLLSTAQESMLQAEKAKVARLAFEKKIEDLNRQAITVETLSKEARLELEI